MACFCTYAWSHLKMPKRLKSLTSAEMAGQSCVRSNERNPCRDFASGVDHFVGVCLAHVELRTWVRGALSRRESWPCGNRHPIQFKSTIGIQSKGCNRVPAASVSRRCTDAISATYATYVSESP